MYRYLLFAYPLSYDSLCTFVEIDGSMESFSAFTWSMNAFRCLIKKFCTLPKRQYSTMTISSPVNRTDFHVTTLMFSGVNFTYVSQCSSLSLPANWQRSGVVPNGPLFSVRSPTLWFAKQKKIHTFAVSLINYLHPLTSLPAFGLSILTATVVLSSCENMPVAIAFTTTPNAPAPNCLPDVKLNFYVETFGEREILTQKEFCLREFVLFVVG